MGNSASVEVEDEASADDGLEQVLGVVNLSAETKKIISENYPTLEEFEKFVKLSFDAVKAFHMKHGELKEPRFKKYDREKFIILRRWTEAEENQDDGIIVWGSFNEQSFNDFCEQAPKHDLCDALKKLGVYDKIVEILKANSIESPAHFVQKPMSWYAKLCKEEQGSDIHQSKTCLLSGSDKDAIQKFKEWYNHHSMGYLPSNWVTSFQNDNIHPVERDLRRILREIGLNTDAIDALKMNDIKNVASLNRTSTDWRTERDGDENSRPYEWKLMGLTRNDASHIISFRHWHAFYIVGRSNTKTKNWTNEFNSTQYNNFLERYQPGDDFSKPSKWKFWKSESLEFPQEKHDYYDLIQKAVEAGDVTNEQRYHLIQFYNKREKMQLVEEIEMTHYEGHRDGTLEEDRLHELLQQDEEEDDEKEQGELLFDRQFCQFYFSAFLAYVLLWFWVGTTIYFMIQAINERKAGEELEERQGSNQNNETTTMVMATNNTISIASDRERDSLVEGNVFEEHPGFDFVSFIHNVLFGLVTAVVVKELDDEEKETSLYDRFLPIYRKQRRRQRNCRIVNNIWTGDKWEKWEFLKTEFKTVLTWVILWSTRAYIVLWICFGTISLAFGALFGIDNSNPLYVTGQAWLGVAVTISYTYFGLSGKIANDNIGQSSTGAIQGITDGSDTANDKGTTGGNDKSDGEAMFSDKGKRMAIRTHHELNKEIDHYNALLTEAIADKRFEDAAGHQRYLDQLYQLKETFPSLAELQSQLADLQGKARAAADEQDYAAALDFQKDVVKLQNKVKEEEEDAAAAEDVRPT